MTTDSFFTTHLFFPADARDLGTVPDGSIHLVVTSPPYPMISMWDGVFSGLSHDIGAALERGDGYGAFELMHAELDKVWRELYRASKNGGFVCINIGDATRTLDGRFRLYPNHSRIIASCVAAGFDCLPVVLWRKQTNAPNKFMGSGMLPAGAYVTLEHEYILVFRKGGKREFSLPAEKHERMASALFWEERNTWFSDVWDFKGVRQRLTGTEVRGRSAAFPLELAFRLVNMYSLYGDTVLDPFAGTGTTLVASAMTGRNSIGADIDPAFASVIAGEFENVVQGGQRLLADRVAAHHSFIDKRVSGKGPGGYVNVPHGFPVTTKQETQLRLRKVTAVKKEHNGAFRVDYENAGYFASAGEVVAFGRETEAGASGQVSLDL